MTSTGQLTRKVEFRQRASNANGSRDGPWVDVVTCSARVQARFGGETFQAARMEGEQPVTITVRRDRETKAIDNTYSARDARDLTIVWDIRSVIVSEDRAWMEIFAVQRLGGDDDE